MKKIFLLFASLMFSGCAMGPLVSHETARTLGHGNKEILGGYGSAGYLVKFNYGASDNLDVGVQLESYSMGLRAKYSLLNSSQGWSYAIAGGLGASVGGTHYYGDLMASYLNKAWEPYGTVRFVHIVTDPMEFKDENTGDVDFTVSSTRYNYGQFMLGTRYHFNNRWMASAELSSLFGLSHGVSISSGVLLGVSMGYKF